MSGKNHQICIVFILVLFHSISFSQHQITLKPTIGGYIYNSENSLKVMGDENYFLNYGFEVSYENKDLFGYDMQVDYSYIYSGIDNVLEFVRTGPDDPTPIGFTYSDVSLSLHTFDFELKNEIDEYFSYGFGPSFSFVNRSFILEADNFIDRLASFAVGLNASIDIKYPLTNDEAFIFLYSGIKCRYLFGLLYDKGLRDLSDYNQHFVTGNFSIGLGYSF
jgi:hypothetical protein